MKILILLFIIHIEVIIGFEKCMESFHNIMCPDPNVIKYFLYTSNNYTYLQIYPETLENITYNKNCKFIIITHGFLINGFSKWILNMIGEFFKHDCFNIIVVDWSIISSLTNYIPSAFNLIYPYTAFRTCCVGEHVGQFIINLHKIQGVKFKNIHFVGHSLGAHLSGCAGKYVFTNTRKRIARITGLDPAGPLFNGISKHCRLSKDDAKFVDCIHTDRSIFGYFGLLGHVDFFPNGGATQPGCPFSSITSEIPIIACNHCFAIDLFMASINSRGFNANTCNSYSSYECNQCSNSPKAEMGYHARKTESGYYYLDTNSYPPYALHGKTIGKIFSCNDSIIYK